MLSLIRTRREQGARQHLGSASPLADNPGNARSSAGYTHLVLVPTRCRDATQDRGREELEGPFFFLPLDGGGLEHVAPSRIEVRGYDGAEPI